MEEVVKTKKEKQLLIQQIRMMRQQVNEATEGMEVKKNTYCFYSTFTINYTHTTTIRQLFSIAIISDIHTAHTQYAYT